MFDSIYKDLSYRIRTGGFWLRVIVLCVIVFYCHQFTEKLFQLFQCGLSGEIYYDIINSICLSSDLWHNIKFPWVWITPHVFVHEGFFHLLWICLAFTAYQYCGRSDWAKTSHYHIFEAAISGGLFSYWVHKYYPGIKALKCMHRVRLLL